MRPKGLVVVDEKRIAQVMEATPEVIAAYLFGSAARGETDQFSDVDVAVLLEDDLPKERRWDIEGRLLDQLFRIVGQDKADVVDLKTAPLWFQRVVITTGRVIYERDRQKREAYERQVLQQQEADEGRWRKMEEMRLRLEVLERNLERI
jgi:predicted nucleotidyltransferase